MFARLIRFAIVGLLASAIHYAVYALALTLGASANLAYTAGFLVSLCCNYALTTYFTFRQRPSRRNAVGFAMSHLLNYFVEIGFLNFFLWLGLSRELAPIAVLAIAVPTNFVLVRFVFKHFKRT